MEADLGLKPWLPVSLHIFMMIWPIWVSAWHLILPDYSQVADYHTCIYINDEDYCLLTPNELTVEKVPKVFSKEIYVRIHERFERRPQIQPPHVRIY